MNSLSTLLIFLIITIAVVESRLGRVRSKALKDSTPSRIQLFGNFTYCDVNNLKSAVELNDFCRPETKPPVKNLVNIALVSKLHYILDTKAFECYRKKVVRYLNTTFFGVKSESYFYIESPLTPVECVAMVESKSCNSQPMECTDDGCFYDQLPEGQFSWFQDVKLWTYNCKFHRREVQAEKNTSVVFSNALNTCTPPDLFCQLSRSIVIWKKSDVRHFMYQNVLKGYNYTLSGNLLYSKEERYLFQLTNTVFEREFVFHRTTEGLFVFMLPVGEDQQLLHLLDYELSYGYYPSYTPKIASLFDLQLAESDFQLDSIQDEFQKKMNQEHVKNCVIFTNFLRHLSDYENRFHIVRDYNDNDAILYSKFGQLFLPRCEMINNVTIAQYEQECFFDTPVEVIDGNKRSVTLFLNKKNFLIDYSPRLKNCSSVNTRHMINKTHFLIRIGNNLKVNAIADLKFIKLNYENYDYDRINFDHHSQIIDGYDLINDFHEPHSENENDMDEHYHILPEDNIDEKHSIINEWKDTIYSQVGSWWDNIMSSIRSFFFKVMFVFALIVMLFFLYLARSNSQIPGIFIGSSAATSSLKSSTTTPNQAYKSTQNNNNLENEQFL